MWRRLATGERICFNITNSTILALMHFALGRSVLLTAGTSMWLIVVKNNFDKFCITVACNLDCLKTDFIVTDYDFNIINHHIQWRS
jgi:hypothetical protein